MNKDDVIQLAEEADWPESMIHPIIMAKLADFANLVAKAKAEELATALEKGPVNDTAASIAIWIRNQNNV